MLMAAPAGAQGMDPGAGMGHGVGPGFGPQRPPFERAFRFHGIEGRWWDNTRVATALKLTPDQQKAMDGILYQHREKLIDLQADLERANLGMEPLMNADEPNRAAIEAQIDKVVAARAALEKANSNFLLDLRMQLTPDQWKQVKAFREGEMRGPGRPGWGPDGRRPRMHGPGGQFHGPMAPGQGPQGAPQPQNPPTPPPSGSGMDQ